MQQSTPQPNADRARNISAARYWLWDALAMFASQLASLSLCFLIWKHLHPHTVKAPGWFDTLGIAVLAVSVLAAVLATVRIARVSWLAAISSLIFGAASGVFIFLLNRLAPL